MTLPLAVSDHTLLDDRARHRPRRGADRRRACWSLLVQPVAQHRASVDGLLEVAGKVAANTANIPQLEATAPVLALIVEEAVVQDGYMNALTDGFGGSMSTNDVLVLLSVVLAVVVVAVLAARADRGPPRPDAHLRGPRDARRRARGRRGRAPAPARARRQGDQRAVRHHPRRAAGDRAQGRDRRREEAAMTLWWIGDIVLLVVVVPDRRVPAQRRARARPGASSRACDQIADAAAAGLEGPRRRPRCC